MHATLKSLCGTLWEADSSSPWGRPVSVGKQRADAPTEPPVYGSRHQGKVFRDNVGKDHDSAGTDNNLQRSVERAYKQSQQKNDGLTHESVRAMTNR